MHKEQLICWPPLVRQPIHGQQSTAVSEVLKKPLLLEQKRLFGYDLPLTEHFAVSQAITCFYRGELTV